MNNQNVFLGNNSIFPKAVNALSKVLIENVTRTIHPELWDEYLACLTMKFKEEKAKLYGVSIAGSQFIADTQYNISQLTKNDRYKVTIQENCYEPN